MPAAGLTSSLIRRRTRHGGSATSDAALAPPTGSSGFPAGTVTAPGISQIYPSGATAGTTAASAGTSAAATAEAAAAAAAAQQQRLLAKYVLNTAKKELTSNAVVFNAKDQAVGMKESPRQIGQDLHEAAQQIRKADARQVLGGQQAKAVERANRQGKIVPLKGIAKLAGIKRQATAQGVGVRSLQTGLTSEERKNYRAVQQLGEQGGGFGTGIGDAIMKGLGTTIPGTEAGGILSPPGSQLGGASKALYHPVTVGDIGVAAAAGALPELSALKIGSRVAAPVRSAVGASEGQSLIARGVEAGAKKLAPQTSARIAALGERVGARVPGASRYGQALSAKPIRTGTKTLFGGAITAAVAQHPAEQGQAVAGAVSALGHLDARDIAKGGETAAKVVTHLPRAVEYTARSLTDPTVRAQTIYGLKSLGFSAIEFPILAPYEIATKGLQPAASEFIGGYAKDISRRWDPVLNGNYDEFLKQTQKDGAGGVAYMLTELLPLIHGTSVGAKAAVRTGVKAGELAHMPGAVSVRKFLEAERPNLRRGAGAEQVRPQELSKGLAGTVSQRLRDVTGRRLQLRAEAKAGTPYRLGRKAGATRARPVISLGEGETIPTSQFVPGVKRAATYARHRGPARVVSGGRNVRALQSLQITKPMRKIEGRYAKTPELLGYAIEHGAPKSPEAMIRTLEAKKETLPAGAPEIEQLNRALDQIRAHPKTINDRFRRDVQKMQALQQDAEGRTKLVAPEQANTRRLAESAEQLARRPDTQLPSLHDTLGPTEVTRAEEGLAGITANATRASRDLKTAQSGFRQARESLANRKAKVAGSTGRKRASALAAVRRAQAVADHAGERVKQAKADLAQVAAERGHVDKRIEAAKAKDRKRSDLRNRNWQDDARQYVRSVGQSKIEAEAARQGHGAPGYFPAMKRPGTEDVIPQEARSGGMISFKSSQGALARSGGREMSAFMAHHQTARLLDTEMRRAVMQRIETGFGLSLDDLRKGKETPYKSVGERDLTGEQKVAELRAAGHEPKNFMLMNTDTWAKRVANAIETISPHETEKTFSDVFNEALKDASASAETVTADTKGFDGPSASFVPKDEWKVATDLLDMGPQAQKNFIWNRLKTVATRWVLFNPGWFAFQMYAATFLAGIGKPSSLLPSNIRAARKWTEGLDAVSRDNFEAVTGLPITGSPDFEYRAGSLGAGISALDRMKSSPTWEKHFEGKNPMDLFFRGIPRFERPIRRAMLHSEVKKEAWKRMGGNIKKIGAIFDQIGKARGEKNPTLKEWDAIMKEIASDRPTMERLAKNVLQWMGDYETYSSFERTFLQSNLMFYGFLRHSLMLATWTLPVKHPMRLALFAAASKMVDTNQKQVLTQTSRNYLAQFMVEHYGVSEAKAQQAAKKLLPKVTQIPMEMMGRVMFPNGQIVDTVRASPLGNSILQAESPTALLGLLAPGGQIPLSMMTGQNFFTGSPLQTSPTSTGPTLDPRIALSMGLNYISPLRLLSQSVSKYPTSERTAYSFPLPGLNQLPDFGGLNIFKEYPQQYSGSTRNMEYQRQLFRRGVQVSSKGGWRSVEQTMAPFMPHPTAFLPSYVMGQFDPTYGGLHAKAVKKRAQQEAKASSSSSSPGGYLGSTGYKAGSSYKTAGGYLGTSPTKDTGPTLSEAGGRGFYNEIRLDLSTLLGKDFFKGATGAIQEFANTFTPTATKPTQAKDIFSSAGGSVRNPQRLAALPQRLDTKAKQPKKSKASHIPVPTGGGLSSNQQVFAGVLAKETGLDPAVIGAWIVSEGPAGDQVFNATQNQNWLALGYPGQQTSTSQGSEFNDPVSAAKATALALKGKKYGMGAAIPSIITTAGQSKETQINAIANSGWVSGTAGTNDYSGGSTLRDHVNDYSIDRMKVKGVTAAPATARGGPYTYPFGKNIAIGRTDMGIDPYGPGAVRTIGKARYLGTGGSGWPTKGGSGTGPVYKLLKGPQKGRRVYTYEGITPRTDLKKGDVLKKGEVIARSTGSSFETGFAQGANAGFQPIASPRYTEGKVTKSGSNFAKFVGGIQSGGSYPLGGQASFGGTTGQSTSGYASTPVASYSSGSVAPSTIQTAQQSVGRAKGMTAMQKLRVLRILNQPNGALKLLGIPGAFTDKGTVTPEGEKFLASLSADRLRLLNS